MAGASRLTVEAAQILIGERRKGLTLTDCAEAASISKTSLCSWLRRGQESPPNTIHAVFADAFARAYTDYTDERAQELSLALIPIYSQKSVNDERLEVV